MRREPGRDPGRLRCTLLSVQSSGVRVFVSVSQRSTAFNERRASTCACLIIYGLQKNTHTMIGDIAHTDTQNTTHSAQAHGAPYCILQLQRGDTTVNTHPTWHNRLQSRERNPAKEKARTASRDADAPAKPWEENFIENLRRAPAMQSRAIQILVWWRRAILILPSPPLGSCGVVSSWRADLESVCFRFLSFSQSRAMTQVRPARSVHTTRTRQRSVGGVHHLPGAPVVLPAPRTPVPTPQRQEAKPARGQAARDTEGYPSPSERPLATPRVRPRRCTCGPSAWRKVEESEQSSRGARARMVSI